jgi:hypothetical protein
MLKDYATNKEERTPINNLPSEDFNKDDFKN